MIAYRIFTSSSLSEHQTSRLYQMPVLMHCLAYYPPNRGLTTLIQTAESSVTVMLLSCCRIAYWAEQASSSRQAADHDL